MEERPPSPLHLRSRQSTFVHPSLHLCSSALCWFQGVAVDVLGTFYILRKRICEGTRPMIVPRFHLSQRVAQAQGLIYTNSDIPGKALAQALLTLAAVPACEFAVEERPRKLAVALQENISPGAHPLHMRCAKSVCLGVLASRQHCMQCIPPSDLPCCGLPMVLLRTSACRGNASELLFFFSYPNCQGTGALCAVGTRACSETQQHSCQLQSSLQLQAGALHLTRRLQSAVGLAWSATLAPQGLFQPAVLLPA